MIVPGSMFGPLLGREQDHAHSWYAVVEDKKTGKRWTYWINGSQSTREAIADHIRIFYPNVKVVTIDKTEKRPDKVLQPIPKEHFQPDVKTEPEEPEVQMPGIGAKPIISVPSFSPPKPLWQPPR